MTKLEQEMSDSGPNPEGCQARGKEYNLPELLSELG